MPDPALHWEDHRKNFGREEFPSHAWDLPRVYRHHRKFHDKCLGKTGGPLHRPAKALAWEGREYLSDVEKWEFDDIFYLDCFENGKCGQNQGKYNWWALVSNPYQRNHHFPGWWNHDEIPILNFQIYSQSPIAARTPSSLQNDFQDPQTGFENISQSTKIRQDYNIFYKVIYWIF